MHSIQYGTLLTLRLLKLHSRVCVRLLAVRSGFTDMSLGSIGSVSVARSAHRRKERWRTVRGLPDGIRKLEHIHAAHETPPMLSEEQLEQVPRGRPWQQYEVCGLYPGSVHTFRVKARNTRGWGDVSPSSIEASVPADVPMVPFDVVATPLSPYSVLIRWKSPHHNGSPLQFYHLQACRMRFCDDANDSDSDLDRCPGGFDERGRAERIQHWATGGAMPVRDRGTAGMYHGYLSFGPIDKIFMFSVTFACARRTGAASHAFERMHNTLSHGSKT